MIERYIKPENMGESLCDLADSVRGGVPSAVFGVSFSEKCHIASTLNLPVLYLCRDALIAKKVAAEAANYAVDSVFLPAKDDVLLYNKAVGKDSLYERLSALYRIKKGARFVATTFEALLQLMPSSVDGFTLKKGGEYSFDALISRLVSMGYSRVEEIDRRGEFCVRGDIFQIFPIDRQQPLRIDFFGDVVERIMVYESVGGTYAETIDSCEIIAAKDFSVDGAEIPLIKKRLTEEVRAFGANLYAVRAREICRELIDTLDTDPNSQKLNFIAPLVSKMRGKISDYMPRGTVIIYDECKMLSDSLYGLLKEHSERCLSLSRNGECFSFSQKQYKDEKQLSEELSFGTKLALQTLTSSVSFFSPLKTFRINCTPVARYSLKPGDFFTDVAGWKRTGYRVIVCCGSGERADRLFQQLEERKIFSVRDDNAAEDFSGVLITSYNLSEGFIYHEPKIAVIGTGDIYAKKEREKKIKHKRGDLYTAPEIGDYCVHEVHGVGIVRGVTKITTTDGTKDYVSIEYRGGDMLYVCVDRMDSLTKYLGGEEKPSLSKIGGQEFERIKERVKASIARLTINLKKLYRDRKEKKGYAFSQDNALTEEFAESFKFEETEDQLESIEEIYKDMESDKVMDRLLCGDVGYGKTEVALRAAFKAVADGKQVAFIAPTTILTEQHYMTCLERFKDFGVRVGVLNRFRSSSDQEKTLYKTENGEIDVLIGTHRMFSSDVRFKDLGLLIIDEEQRFGVEHKEKLKLLKDNVDTLTMSATPIPRTLNMSLTGIRDISTINTPPVSRIPVQTFVVEESDALIRDALSKELSREGQAFILYNHVESIAAFASRVKNIMPEARVIVGHGQMPEKTLENNIYAFYRGEYDVLVSTTIIENGVDLPNANTLIVIDADAMGLSTLYQLKGRVGRSDKLARAYFTYKAEKILSDAAYKRLFALMEFTELGSGIKIAMRDLEIRGAGNVLGKEQHGHMDKIGYELYTKLLKEQLGEVTANFETELDIGVSAYIPDAYVRTSALRMDCYKQIAEIRSAEDENRVINSLKENYGEIPRETMNLVRIARLKLYCSKLEVIKVELSEKKGRLIFKNLDSLNNPALMDALDAYKNTITLSFGENPYASIKKDGLDNERALLLMTQFAERAADNCEKAEK